jgi:hypothetical protein
LEFGTDKHPLGTYELALIDTNGARRFSGPDGEKMMSVEFLFVPTVEDLAQIFWLFWQPDASHRFESKQLKSHRFEFISKRNYM